METNTNQGGCCVQKFKEPKFVLLITGMVLLAAIVVISIIRDRIVNQIQNQVTVTGQGKVIYQPDEANVTLGVQVDKIWSAEEALRQLNEKMNRVMAAVKEQGIEEGNIKTESYNLYPQYDYTDGKTSVSGYNAQQNIKVKVSGVDKNPEMVGKVVSAANSAGVNNISGINFSVSSVNDLKQQARIKAIQDAKSKAADLFKAAGVKPKKITGWYENIVQVPGAQNDYDMGMGGIGGPEKAAAPSPQVPSGNQEIAIEIGVNYEVK